MVEFLLQGKSRLSCDIFSITLSPQHMPLESIPGQYVKLLGDHPLSLSIAEVSHNHWLTFHLRETASLRYESFELDKQYYFSGPFGTTTITEKKQGPLILISGGTGFAPFCRLIPHVCKNKLSDNVFLYWGVNDKSDLYADKQLAALQAQYPTVLHYHPIINMPRTVPQPYRTGWVHEAVLSDFTDLSNATVLASGPWAMIQAIQSTFYANGLPRDQLLSDFIAPRYHIPES